MLPTEQITQIKEQIVKQIETTFPEDKKESAKQQITAMNAAQLEEFLKQNNIMQDQQCIFCSIISGEASSYNVGKNKDAIAILEINPISEGHVLILPKKHSEEIPQSATDLAKEISKLLKSKLNPKDVLVTPSSLFGHRIINLIPVYKNETLESERHKASSEELEASLKKILAEPKKPIEKPMLKKIKEKLWLPKRIP